MGLAQLTLVHVLTLVVDLQDWDMVDPGRYIRKEYDVLDSPQ